MAASKQQRKQPTGFSVGSTTPTMPQQQTQKASQATLDAAQGTSTSPAPSMPKTTQSQQTTTPKIPLADMQASVNKKQNSFSQADYNTSKQANEQNLNNMALAAQRNMTQQQPMMAKGGAVKKKTVKMAKGGAVVKTANCGASMKPAQKRK